jgi:hypothetical protein
MQFDAVHPGHPPPGGPGRGAGAIEIIVVLPSEEIRVMRIGPIGRCGTLEYFALHDALASSISIEQQCLDRERQPPVRRRVGEIQLPVHVASRRLRKLCSIASLGAGRCRVAFIESERCDLRVEPRNEASGSGSIGRLGADFIVDAVLLVHAERSGRNEALVDDDVDFIVAALPALDIYTGRWRARAGTPWLPLPTQTVRIELVWYVDRFRTGQARATPEHGGSQLLLYGEVMFCPPYDVTARPFPNLLDRHGGATAGWGMHEVELPEDVSGRIVKEQVVVLTLRGLLEAHEEPEPDGRGPKRRDLPRRFVRPGLIALGGLWLAWAIWRKAARTSLVP